LAGWKTWLIVTAVFCSGALGLRVVTREEGHGGPPLSTRRDASAHPPLHSADEGRLVRLRQGQTVSVALPALSASGYRCWLRDPLSTPLSLEQVPPRVGGPQGWVFRAAQPGRVGLRFECRQELSDEPAREVLFQVQID